MEKTNSYKLSRSNSFLPILLGLYGSTLVRAKKRHVEATSAATLRKSKQYRCQIYMMYRRYPSIVTVLGGD